MLKTEDGSATATEPADYDKKMSVDELEKLRTEHASMISFLAVGSDSRAKNRAIKTKVPELKRSRISQRKLVGWVAYGGRTSGKGKSGGSHELILPFGERQWGECYDAQGDGGAVEGRTMLAMQFFQKRRRQGKDTTGSGRMH